MSAVDRVLHVMAEMDERDREVVAGLVRMFAAGDRTGIDAVQAALDAGDLERMRRLVGVRR